MYPEHLRHYLSHSCWMCVVVACLSVWGCQATQPATQPSEAAQQQEQPPADNDHSEEPQPTTREEAEELVRNAVRLMLPKVLAKDGVDEMFTEPARRLEPAWLPNEELVTFHVESYTFDVPRRLIGKGTNMRAYRGGVSLRFQGRCSFWVRTDDDLIAPNFRNVGDLFKLPDNDRAELERIAPGYADAMVRELNERLTFDDDFEAYRTFWSTDIRSRFAHLDEMSSAEAIATFLIACLKTTVGIDGSQHRAVEIETPHMRGFVVGRVDLTCREIAKLFDSGKTITLDFNCPEHWQPDPSPSHPSFESIVASLRRCETATPGADMLAAARRESARGSDDNAQQIARCLVMAAARYDDTFEEAREFGHTLIDPAGDEKRTSYYLEMLDTLDTEKQ